MTANPTTRPGIPRRKVSLRSILLGLAIGIVGCWLLASLLLVAAKWIDPPTTAVHMERRVEAWIRHKPYRLRYQFVPLSQISPDMQHAVIAAEDERFFQHHGFDWHAIELAAEEDEKGGHRLRGGSTITQQLVKNLLLGTSRSYLRKGAEFTLVPVAEFVLGKQRILELYLNEVELGPGIYGVEAASRAYYGIPARKLNREQAARLAAVLPLPLKRRPNRMDHYSEIILDHMRQMGW